MAEQVGEKNQSSAPFLSPRRPPTLLGEVIFRHFFFFSQASRLTFAAPLPSQSSPLPFRPCAPVWSSSFFFIRCLVFAFLPFLAFVRIFAFFFFTMASVSLSPATPFVPRESHLLPRRWINVEITLDLVFPLFPPLPF